MNASLPRGDGDEVDLAASRAENRQVRALVAGLALFTFHQIAYWTIGLSLGLKSLDIDGSGGSGGAARIPAGATRLLEMPLAALVHEPGERSLHFFSIVAANGVLWAGAGVAVYVAWSRAMDRWRPARC